VAISGVRGIDVAAINTIMPVKMILKIIFTQRARVGVDKIVKIMIKISWQALLTATAAVSTVSTNPGLDPQASRVTLNSQCMINQNSKLHFSHRERGENR
jgi:hypothetical protein